MNNLVSIVYLITDNFISTAPFDFIHHYVGVKESEMQDDAIVKVNKVCDLDVEIIVGYDVNSNPKSIDYFNKFADKLIEVSDVSNEADSYNKIFKECSNDYVCILKPNCFLDDGWLNELIAYSKIIHNVGCISIVSNLMACEYISLISSDNETMVGVYLPKEEYFDVFGVLFFARQYLYFVGALDTTDSVKNYVFEQWQMRCARMGFNNFAIPSQTCIYFPSNSNRCKDDLENTIATVEDMRKSKTYYIPLETI